MGEVGTGAGTPDSDGTQIELSEQPERLTAREIGLIDEALDKVRPDGEVVLTVQKGRLRFISVTEERRPKDE